MPDTTDDPYLKSLDHDERMAELADRHNIAAGRRDLSYGLAQALESVRVATAALARLANTDGDGTYDVEFAEGQNGIDLREHLRAAGLSLRAADALAARSIGLTR